MPESKTPSVVQASGLHRTTSVSTPRRQFDRSAIVDYNSAFISRTAARRPTNTARLTIE